MYGSDWDVMFSFCLGVEGRNLPTKKKGGETNVWDAGNGSFLRGMDKQLRKTVGLLSYMS